MTEIQAAADHPGDHDVHPGCCRRSPTSRWQPRAARAQSGVRPTSTPRPRSAPSARSRPCSASRRSAWCSSSSPTSPSTSRAGRLRRPSGPRRVQRRAGATLGGALLFIGIGLIQWARKLMGDHEIVEMRHPARSSDEDREATLHALNAGAEESGIARRPLVRNSLLGAVGILLGPGRRPAARPRPHPNQVAKEPIPRRRPRAHRLGQGHARRPRRGRHPDPPRRPRDRRPVQRRARDRSSPVDEEGEHVLEGVALQIAKSKGAVVLIRMDPDDNKPGPGPRELGHRRDPLLLQDLHPRRVPDLAERAQDPPPAVPVPPVDVRPGRRSEGRLRPCRPPAPPAAADGGRRGVPRGTERLQGTGRPQLLGARLPGQHER